MICELLFFCLLRCFGGFRSELLLTFWWVDDDSGTLLLGCLAGKFLKNETLQLHDTLPKLTVCSEKWWLGRYFHLGFGLFQRPCQFRRRECLSFSHNWITHELLQVEMNGRNSVSWKLGELSMKKATATGCIHVNNTEPHQSSNHPSYAVYFWCLFFQWTEDFNLKQNKK